MNSLLIWYSVFSYAIIFGIIWEADSDDLWAKILVWLFSPLALPVYVGMLLSRLYNK